MTGTPAYDPAAPRVGGWALGLRISAVSAPPALMALWLALPPLHPPPLQLAGPATAERVCVGPWCREVVAVGGRPLACRADFIGLPEDCRLRGAGKRGLPSAVLSAEPVEARAIALPSLLSLLGLAPTEAVLLELRQGGQTLFRRPLQAQAWAALYGGWLFHAVYWPIAGLLLWRWPRSGLSRRLWARLTWQQPPR
jgi:hypothetical protein